MGTALFLLKFYLLFYFKFTRTTNLTLKFNKPFAQNLIKFKKPKLDKFDEVLKPSRVEFKFESNLTQPNRVKFDVIVRPAKARSENLEAVF